MTNSSPPLLAMLPTSPPCPSPALAFCSAGLSSFSHLSTPFPTDSSSSFRWPSGPHHDRSWQVTRKGIQQKIFYCKSVASCGCRSEVKKIPLRSDMRPGSTTRNREFGSRNSFQNVKHFSCSLQFSKLSRAISVRSKQGSQESEEKVIVEDADSFIDVAHVPREFASKGDAGFAGTVPRDVTSAINNGAPYGHDNFRDSTEKALHDGENEAVLRKTAFNEGARDVEAEQIGLSDFQADETRDEWEGWETGNAESEGVPLPSTIERTSNKGSEQEDAEDRFRFRNGREVFEERAYLVGIDRKGGQGRASFGIMDSLEELKQLADTAGLAVVGSTYQKLESPNPKTYIGGGKVTELKTAIQAFKVETVIFDDELSPGQARNLEKAFGNVRVCDRTALILDIFSQRAATREASLQVELAQFEYQLPRLTKMWTHLERQAGGMVKGMGEKQIEVDKRILRTRMATLRKSLESVRQHRQQYRDRRAAVPIPVISLVGYTNAGKSTFLNRLSGADVLAEDRLFATLDPTTRRVELPNGKDCLFTDTVGFIQKLPTQLVASFRATLEEITDSSLIVHMVDISHPMAVQQIEAVESVLAELDVNHIPRLTVWNKIDAAKEPERLREKAIERGDVVCLSALTGEGMDEFCDAVGQCLKDSMVWVEAVVPYAQGDIVSVIHGLGIVDEEEYVEKGTLMKAYVPLSLSKQLLPYRQACT